MIKKFFDYSLIIFIIALSLRIYYINQKQGFHMDEFLALETITNTIEEYHDFFLETNIGKSPNFKLFKKPKTTILNDLKGLWKNNNKFVEHPPLYHSLLRIFMNSSDYSPESYKKLGCTLNVLLFIFSFFIMKKLLIKLFGDNKLVPIGLAVSFLNTGSISMTIFIRPYELEFLAIILITLVFASIADKLNKTNSSLQIKDYLIISLSLMFVFLSGYFLTIYVFILGFFLLFFARKNIITLFFLILTALSSIIFVNILYPSYFQFMNTNSYIFDFVIAKLNFHNKLILSNLIFYLKITINYLFYPLIITILTIALILFKDEYNKKIIENKIIFLIIFSTIIFAILISITSPFKTLRYILPALPLLSIIFVLLFQKITPYKQKLFGIIFVLLYVLAAIFPFKTEASETQISYPNKFYIPFGAKIENIFPEKLVDIKENLPIVIESKDVWNSHFLLADFKDDYKYYFKYRPKKTILIMDFYPSDHFYLLADNKFKLIQCKYKMKFLKKFKMYYLYEITK